jgi:hypothetical protein
MMWSDYPCIESDWPSATKDGYRQRQVPKTGRGGPKEYAHRRALEAKLGRLINPGMLACHHCDNPPCIQPEHLYEGTESDNRRDMYARRRRWSVPLERREEIRRLYKDGNVTMEELAKRFGIGHTTVCNIIHEGI